MDIILHLSTCVGLEDWDKIDKFAYPFNRNI